MKVRIKKTLKTLPEHGDTIVEVLIAITIAAFAISISYATAERSLQQAISAREHGEALDILENQVADLSYRFQEDSNFNGNFANKPNFCLKDNIKPSDTSNWSIQPNTVTPNSQPAAPPYNSACQTIEGGVQYFANIAPSGSVNKYNPTLYTITVRWYKIGGGINQASLYYKLNGDKS